MVAEVENVRVGEWPAAVAYDRMNGNVYVANLASNNITVLNATTNAIVGWIRAGTAPRGLTINPTEGYLYATNDSTNSLDVVNVTTERVVFSVPVGDGPSGVAYDNRSGLLYVANSNSNTVTVINTSTGKVLGTTRTGSGPTAVLYDGSNGLVYVTNTESDNVSVINGTTTTVLDSIPVGAGPYGLAFDTISSLVYVVNSQSDSVSVINGSSNRMVGSIDVGTWPFSAAVDDSEGLLYVANGGGNVTVVDLSTDLARGSITLGGSPLASGIDTSDGCLYVTNVQSDSVSVIPRELRVSLAADPAQTDPGVRFTLRSQAYGGLLPYMSYSWRFGDGTTAQGPGNETTHSYENAGQYVTNVTVMDAYGFNATASATITVNPNPNASIPSPSKPAADIGESVAFSESVSGGTPPYVSYDWTGLPVGCAGTATNQVRCILRVPGNLSITVAVTDSQGATSSPSQPLVFQVFTDPVALGPSANQSSTDVGLSVEFVENATGGPGTFATFVWTGFETATCTSVQSSRPSCTFSHPGTYPIAVSAIDGNGVATLPSPPLTFLVLARPSVAEPTTNVTSADVNESVTFAAAASGGAGGYRYLWQGLPSDCLLTGTAQVVCTMTAPGTWNVTVVAVDANGGASLVSPSRDLAVFFDPVAGTPMVTPGQVPIGGQVKIHEEVAGGSGNDSYSWTGLPPGCDGTTDTITCEPTEAGTFHVSVAVKDSNGFEATSLTSTLLIVTAPPPAFLGLPVAEGYGVLGGIIVASVVAAVIMILLRQRSEESSWRVPL
jgi:YVTN family beta-propeller protein